MHPAIIAAIAVGGFLVLRKSAAAPAGAGVSATGVRKGILPTGGTSYANPVGVAAALANSVVALTRGFTPANAAEASNGRWLDLSPSERLAAHNGGYGLPVSWTGADGPNPIIVTYSGGDPYSADVDSMINAPVYNASEVAAAWSVQGDF